MSWNYRMMAWKGKAPVSEPFLAIHEVHYDEAGRPIMHTAEPTSPQGESTAELAYVIGLMLLAFGKPILAWDETNGYTEEAT